jgi:hypothetical protein
MRIATASGQYGESQLGAIACSPPPRWMRPTTGEVFSQSKQIDEEAVTGMWQRQLLPLVHAAPLHSCKYRWLHAPATNAFLRNPRQIAGFFVLRRSRCGRCHAIATVEQSDRALDGGGTQVHVPLRRCQVAMSGNLLNCSCRGTAHRQMRTERVAQDVNADIPKVCSPSCARPSLVRRAASTELRRRRKERGVP